MIVGDLIYDKKGNVILPPIPKEDPPLTEHFDITPKVIHRVRWVAHNEESFETAYDTALAMLSEVPGFTLVSEKPTFDFFRTPAGILKNYYMEMIYYIDPKQRKKRSLIDRILNW